MQEDDSVTSYFCYSFETYDLFVNWMLTFSFGRFPIQLAHHLNEWQFKLYYDYSNPGAQN